MTRTLFFILCFLALGAPQLIPQNPQPAAVPAVQAAGFGTIHGTVVREGTNEPIPDAQIALAGRGGITAQEAQTLLNALSRGGAGANIPADVLQMAQEAARGGQTALTAVSDGEGKFTLGNVPAGAQNLRVQIEGYFARGTGGQYLPIINLPVTVMADKTTDVKASLVAGATISGRVFDQAGKPVSDAQVQVMQMGYENGALMPQTAEIKQTDDRGEYRVYRLPPGEYLVAASPRPQALILARGGIGLNPQEVQIATYYPNVPDDSTATRVALRGGDDVTGINIQMRTAPSLKVSGRVTSTVPPGPTAGPRGQTRTGGVILVPTRTRGLLSFDGAGAINLNADGGTFEFTNVAPGEYDVIARISTAAGGGWGPQSPPALATGPWAFGRTTIDARNGNIENVSIVVRSGVDVKGRVLLDGKPIRANARITLQPEDSARSLNDQQITMTLNQIRQYPAPIGEDGSFVIPLLPEGRYRFQVALNAPATPARGARGAAAAPAAAPELPPAAALPAGAFLADIRQGGTSVYDNGLVVGTSTVNPVDVFLSTAGGSVEGTLSSADQKPVAQMTVVLVPPEGRRQNSALYRTSLSDPQGRFRFANLPAGSYTLYAWEFVPAGAYQNAEFLARYAGRGSSVTVAAGARTTASVNVIRENPSGR